MRSAVEIVDQVALNASTSACVAVALPLPTALVVARYRPDPDEHVRRSAMCAGPVVSTSLLSALWEMPAGIPIPATVLLPTEVDALVAAGLVVGAADGLVRREFAPCGAVLALFAVAVRADAALRQASLLSPIYERYAVVASQVDPAERARLARAADRCGVGLVVADSAVPALIPAPHPALGRPHVFRWWMTEMAYASWLEGRS